jgi:hypothetical protein
MVKREIVHDSNALSEVKIAQREGTGGLTPACFNEIIPISH